MKRFDRSIAYLLCALGFLGFGGLHRFYLKRTKTGILWLFTAGLCYAGTIYDLVNMQKLIDKAEEEEYFRDRERRGVLLRDEERANAPSRDGIEDLIVRLAEDSGGFVTISTLAVEGGMESAEAREILDRLVLSGVAEKRRLPSGVEAYHFASFWAEKGAHA